MVLQNKTPLFFILDEVSYSTDQGISFFGRPKVWSKRQTSAALLNLKTGLSKKLIKAVAPLFLEKDDMVQISALGALR